MKMLRRIDRFFSGVEWKLSLGTILWGLIFPAGSFALPAWGSTSIAVLSEYAPLSWIVAGFSGVLAYALAVALFGYGRHRAVRARYDANFMRETGGVDPMAKVFESKRIYLNDFVLPSNPFIEGKTFVDCEILGPANLYLSHGNNVNMIDAGTQSIDAVALIGENVFKNGFVASNCQFTRCTFHRVTLFFHPDELPATGGLHWLNWISPLPPQQMLPGIDADSGEEAQHQSHPETAT